MKVHKLTTSLNPHITHIDPDARLLHNDGR